MKNVFEVLGKGGASSSKKAAAASRTPGAKVGVALTIRTTSSCARARVMRARVVPAISPAGLHHLPAVPAHCAGLGRGGPREPVPGNAARVTAGADACGDSTCPAAVIFTSPDASNSSQAPTNI